MAPLVEEMLQRLNSEVNRYDRVITFWHQFGPDLEAAVCTVLRETTAAVTRQCGLVAVVRLLWTPEHFTVLHRFNSWPALHHYISAFMIHATYLQQRLSGHSQSWHD